MATAEMAALMKAEEFGRRPDPGHPEELVRGRIVRRPPTKPRHGEVCAQCVHLFKRFLDDHDVGRVVGNDAGVIIRRDPDTVRGPDVAFYSYERLPKGPLPRGYLPQIPELVVEVRSPGDRWKETHEKVAEFLGAGVLVVVVLDPGPKSAHVFGAEEEPRKLGADDELALPGILEGFRLRVGRFFE
jgi:Uma2 family endonuclease